MIALIFGAIGLITYFGTYRWGTKFLARFSGKTGGARSTGYGALFSFVYFLGFPYWWWRYGLRRTVQLLLSCVAAGMTCGLLVRLLPIDPEDSMFAALLAGQLVGRALGGHWIAVVDARWRREIVQRRRIKAMIGRIMPKLEDAGGPARSARLQSDDPYPSRY